MAGRTSFSQQRASQCFATEIFGTVGIGVLGVENCASGATRPIGSRKSARTWLATDAEIQSSQVKGGAWCEYGRATSLQIRKKKPGGFPALS
jgi:hypothetical protein